MIEGKFNGCNFKKSKKICEVLKVIFSGVAGVLITIAYQHFFNQPSSFTFIYNGDEILVTEAEYVEIIEENQELKNQLESMRSDISSLQNQLEEQSSVQAAERLIEQATTYWNNADFIQALTILKNTNIQSDDVRALYSKYSTEYSMDLLNQADILIQEKKYDDALKLLTDGERFVSDSVAIQHKITEINNNAPTKLSDLKISSSRFFSKQEGKPLLDTIGNSYPTGNLFATYAEGDSEYGYASFYVGEKYTELTGIIAVSDGSEDVGLEGWIEIYSKKGDDYTRLYQSPILNRMTTPIELSGLKWTNADWIEIRYYNNGNYFSIAGGYHSLNIIIADVTVYSL